MTIITEAQALIPGHDDHTQAEKRIVDEITRSRAIKFDSPISTTDFVDAALADVDFPKEPHFHNERIRAERLNAGARAQMLKDALKATQERKRDLIRDHSDSALVYLRAELATLMDDVRANHETLGNIRTAEQVLAADDPQVLSAWQESSGLIARYIEIRGVQHSFTAPSLGDGQNFKIAAVGHIHNSLELSDYWLGKRNKSVSHRAANDPLSGVANYDEWLGSGGDAPFKHSTSAIPQTDSNGNTVNSWDYLVWLATKAEPWVPTLAQILGAWNAAHTAVAPVAYNTYRVQEEARDTYFEVVGTPPIVPYTNAPSGEKAGARSVKRQTWGESAAQLMGL